MFDTIQFTHRIGKKSPTRILVLALSTCGFCKSALEFLDRNGFDYRFVHVDTLPPAAKSRLREEFSSRFGGKLVYPTMILNESEIVQGFLLPSWERALGLQEG
jgi:glutaredoxin